MADLNIMKKTLSKIDYKKRSDTKGITLHCYSDWYDEKSQYGGFNNVQSINEKNEGYGFNYLLDEYDIIEAVPANDIADPWKNKKPTYIATNLYQDKIADNTLSVCIFISSDHDYAKTEENLVKLLTKLTTDYKLKTEDIWRGFDLSKDDKGPLQYLDNDKFKVLLKIVDDYTAFLADPTNQGKDFDFSGTQKNEDVKKVYDEGNVNIDKALAQYEPWDKDKKEVIDAKPKPEVGNLKAITYPTKNKLQFKISSIPPGGGLHCKRAADKLDGIESEEDTMVEPIYPDLVTPPGGQINVANGKYDTAVQSSASSTTPITVEDFEKRQKTFNMKDFSEVKKDTVGRPVNTDDPFPVDEQIKKLEEHFPKVKIDKTTFDFTEDNHPGSVIGAAMAKNYAMCYDMVNEISKRTEKRLVKIENNLATVMRNLFRMSSRVNINCQYYGGQSVYGKYKCIRCMHDNRVDDGAIVTIDQCLCCTRYEPILGQVYAILDDAGSNVSQIVDDLQSSYMELADYQTFNNVNEYNTEPKAATLTKDSSITPKPFREGKWKDTAEERKAKLEAKAKKEAALKAAGDMTEPKVDEKILFKYEDVKDYLDIKLEEVIILNGDEHHQVTREEYIVMKKQEFISSITANIQKDDETKKYYDDSGNVITRAEYIKLLTKKIKDSYYNDDYYNGFKMDWTPNLLETHKPNINEYDLEKLKDGKANMIGETDHQGKMSREVYVDSREKAIQYEKLEFNTKDYIIPGFGSSGGSVSGTTTSTSGIFGGLGGAEVRKKIVDYAKKAVDLCAEGKAAYSQEQRYAHDDNAAGGMNYWDCSSLVQGAYESAGITGVSGNTATEYPVCLDSSGGLLIPISQSDKAIAGDIIWFYSGNIPDDQAGLQNVDYQNTGALHHVGIYIGDGKYAHASGRNSTPNIKISEVSGNPESLAFGRPKDLIDLDKIASQGASGGGALSKEALGISDALWDRGKVADEQVPAFIDNMTKHGYKDTLVNVSKELGYDPYLTAAIITIETVGDPNDCNSSNHNGLMQVSNGPTDPEANMKMGLQMLTDRKPYLTQNGWSENNIHILISAHNAGEGGVVSHAKTAGLDLSKCTVDQVAQAMPNEEQQTYAVKVIRAYGLLYSQKSLG